MPLPITPTPARPVDDAIIETGWGTWAHDLLLAMPRGIVKLGTAPGVNFASLTPDQFATTFPAELGRMYLIMASAVWRNDTAGNVVSWQPWVNGSAGVAMRDTNAIAAAANANETAQLAFYWAAPATLPSCAFKVVGTRLGGTGTCTVSGWTFSVADVGPSAGTALLKGGTLLPAPDSEDLAD